MPMYVQRSYTPVFTAHSETVLNTTLSPSARLLYVVLQASVSGENSAPIEVADLPPLLGLNSPEELAPLLDELDAVGLLDRTHHVGHEPGIQVHTYPAGTSRTRPCQPCTECGHCACENIATDHAGRCRICESRDRLRHRAEADIQRWRRQLDSGATFAHGQHSRMLHRWDCPLLNQPEKSLAALEESLESPDAPGHWPRLPMLYTADELRRKKHRRKPCQNCAPDPL